MLSIEGGGTCGSVEDKLFECETFDLNILCFRRLFLSLLASCSCSCGTLLETFTSTMNGNKLETRTYYEVV